MVQINPANQTALLCFLMVARHFHLDFTLESLAHKYALSDVEVPVSLLLRIAKEHSFRAREVTLTWDRLLHMEKPFRPLRGSSRAKASFFPVSKPDRPPRWPSLILWLSRPGSSF